MTENELLEAGLGRGPVDGVPVAVHAELRELRDLVERLGLSIAVVRELLELVVAVLDVEVDARDVRVEVVSAAELRRRADELRPCPACAWVASHADDCPVAAGDLEP
jgi:hypothetical protein